MNTSYKVTVRSRGIEASVALIIGFSVFLATSQEARANVYAAHLTTSATSWNFQNGAITFTYRLNQPATSVSVEIYRAADPNTVIRTIAGCPTAWGLNEASWDGADDLGQQVPAGSDYKFRVIAIDSVGKTTWTNITPKPDGTNEIGSAQYFAPQGVAVNRDPNSANFGRIYVCSGESALISGNAGATAIGDGLFLLNNDMSFRGGDASPGNGAATANGLLATSSASNISPWKCSINQSNSDQIVVTDFMDGFEDVYLFNGDGTSCSRVLDRTTTGPGTASQTHGNAISAALSGTGSSRRLWLFDEDVDVSTAGTKPDLLRFNIGNTSVNYTTAAGQAKNGGSTTGVSPLHPPTGVTNMYSGRDLKFGRVSGATSVFAVCRRSNATVGNLAAVCYTLSSTAVNGFVWSIENDLMSSASYANMTWNYTACIAVDEERNRVAIGRDGNGAGNGRVVILDIANLNNGMPTYLAGFNSGGANLRSMDFDAAGNLYTSNQTDEHVRMWSPPDGPNSYTTAYTGSMILNCPYPTPTITVQPVGGTTCVGRAFTLSVVADGHGADVTYQWKRGSTNVGTNSPTLTLDPVATTHAGNYTVVVSGCGSVTSSPTAVVTVVANCVPDYDGDTLVNESDYNLWLPCALGPNVPATTECLSATPSMDLDFDGDVDQDDFGLFQKCMNGTDVPNANCVR